MNEKLNVAMFKFFKQQSIEKLKPKIVLEELIIQLQKPIREKYNQKEYIAFQKWAAEVLTMAEHFGLIHPFKGQDRLDHVPAILVLQAIYHWEKFSLQIQRFNAGYEGGKDANP